MTINDYLLDNRAAAAERRFGALSALFDDGTFRHIQALGIQPGWRCWEIGAGGPSVPNWLADRAGPDGHVLATDIDTSWIDGVAPHVEVRRHHVARDDPPSGVFDLIHARLVLCWIPERDQALRRMVGALRPGGWLLIEDFDPGLQSAASIDAHLPDHHNANKLRAGFGALLARPEPIPRTAGSCPGSSPSTALPTWRPMPTCRYRSPPWERSTSPISTSSATRCSPEGSLPPRTYTATAPPSIAAPGSLPRR